MEFCGRKITHTVWIDDYVTQAQTGRQESQTDFCGDLSSQHRLLITMVNDMFFLNAFLPVPKSLIPIPSFRSGST